MNTVYEGNCHCGRIKFTAEVNIESALRCNCSICIRKNAVMLLAENNSFTLIKGENSLSKYQFNTEIAKHYFCKNCGIYTHHKPRSNPNIIRINAGCIDAIDTLSLARESNINDGAAYQ